MYTQGMTSANALAATTPTNASTATTAAATTTNAAATGMPSNTFAFANPGAAALPNMTQMQAGMNGMIGMQGMDMANMGLPMQSMGLQGMPNMQGMPNLQNMPAVPNLPNLQGMQGMQGMQGVGGMPNMQGMFMMPNMMNPMSNVQGQNQPMLGQTPSQNPVQQLQETTQQLQQLTLQQQQQPQQQMQVPQMSGAQVLPQQPTPTAQRTQQQPQQQPQQQQPAQQQPQGQAQQQPQQQQQPAQQQPQAQQPAQQQPAQQQPQGQAQQQPQAQQQLPQMQNMMMPMNMIMPNMPFPYIPDMLAKQQTPQAQQQPAVQPRPEEPRAAPANVPKRPVPSFSPEATQDGTADVPSLKATASTPVSGLAGAIAKRIREHGTADIISLGSEGTNQTVKAMALARTFLNPEEKTILAQSRFINEDGEINVKFRADGIPVEVVPEDTLDVVIRVSASSNVRKTAGAIAKLMRGPGSQGQRIGILTMGADSVNVTVQALTGARTMLHQDGLDVHFKPRFIHVDDEVSAQPKPALQLNLQLAHVSREEELQAQQAQQVQQVQQSTI